MNGLVAYYPFNGNANDESGNGYNGIVNGATLSTDRFGNANNAYDYDGISNSISINDNPLLRFNNSFSISTWVSLGSFVDNYNYVLIGKPLGDEFYDSYCLFWAYWSGSIKQFCASRCNNSSGCEKTFLPITYRV